MPSPHDPAGGLVSYFEAREAFERSIPWWGPFVFVLVACLAAYLFVWAWEKWEKR